jgi:hypothetical protein
MQVRIIFRLVIMHNPNIPYLFYGEYFQYSARHVEIGASGETVNIPEPGIDMFSVHRHFRSNGVRMGDVFPLLNIQQMVQLVPRFGAVANPAFTKDNSMEIGQEYLLNNFDDKETFHVILSYQ